MLGKTYNDILFLKNKWTNYEQITCLTTKLKYFFFREKNKKEKKIAQVLCCTACSLDARFLRFLCNFSRCSVSFDLYAFINSFKSLINIAFLHYFLLTGADKINI